MRSLKLLLSILSLTTFVSSGCGNTGTGGGAVQVTASGESLALGGYAFPPAMMGDPDFVDGWELRFTKFIAVFDNVTLSENPDAQPTDESQTGKLVARVNGPWAIDLHQGGPLAGKAGQGEQAFPIAVLQNQNLNHGAAFDPTARYAFGFDTVPATAAAAAAFTMPTRN